MPADVKGSKISRRNRQHQASEQSSETERETVAGLLAFVQREGMVLESAKHASVPNLVDRLADVPHPCLILVGEHDDAFQRASEVMAAKLPRGRREVLAGAGHVMNLDQPDAFVRAVERFADEVGGL